MKTCKCHNNFNGKSGATLVDFSLERVASTRCEACKTSKQQSTRAKHENKTMKRTNLLLVGLALGAAVAMAPLAGMATIIGSPHDFSSSGSSGYSTLGIATFGHGTTTYENPCQVCHIPHKAALYGAANAPLWNHAVATNATSAGYYITYDQAGSATFNALGLGTLTLGSSVACLSCHDGSIAVNQSYGSTKFNGNGGVSTNVPSWAIEAYDPSTGKFDGLNPGGSLTRMHPIGVNYPAAFAADPSLNAAAGLPTYMLRPSPLTGLANQNVECSSCHDIHQTEGASGSAPDSLVVNVSGGQLCLTCHNK
jgi:predicted CXXCH cytochrome family protein